MWNDTWAQRSRMDSIRSRERNGISLTHYANFGFTHSQVKSYKRLNTSDSITHDGCINTLRWSGFDDGRFLVSGSDDLYVKIWDCSDYMNDIKLAYDVRTGHTRNIFCAELCPGDRNKVISCAADGTVRCNDISSLPNLNEEVLRSSFR